MDSGMKSAYITLILSTFWIMSTNVFPHFYCSQCHTMFSWWCRKYSKLSSEHEQASLAFHFSYTKHRWKFQNLFNIFFFSLPSHTTTPRSLPLEKILEPNVPPWRHLFLLLSLFLNFSHIFLAVRDQQCELRIVKATASNKEFEILEHQCEIDFDDFANIKYQFYSSSDTCVFIFKLKRLQNMIQLETYAMTGFKFFHISRPMILAVSANVVQSNSHLYIILKSIFFS